MNKFEKEIPYIVEIKEDKILLNTTIKRKFCGYLVYMTSDNLCFELNGSHMLVIIPLSWIKYMAPSELHFRKYQNFH